MSFNENLIQFIWQYSLFNFSRLQTLAGEPVQIINPGILNSSSGPDFENAKIKIGATLFHGSVEIHVTGQEWYNHRHQLNSDYNNVILHVCFEKGKVAERQDGTLAPCIELKDKITKATLHTYQQLMETMQVIPCQKLLYSVNAITLSSCIERSGVERLEQRGSYIQSCLNKSNNNWNQVAYSMICRTFGMPNNSDAFEEISWLLPWKFIQKFRGSLSQIEALLYGTLNLDKNSDGYSQTLLKDYQFLSQKWKLQKSNTVLKTGSMRPMALPTVKIAQLAAFLNNAATLFPTQGQNIKSYLTNLASNQTSEYWKTHYSFGKPTKHHATSLTNTGLKHLVINFLAPFLFHYNKAKNSISSFDAVELLSQFSPESNSITRKMKDVGFSNANAFESQALTHLYKMKCKKHLCLSCVIGKQLLSCK